VQLYLDALIAGNVNTTDPRISLRLHLTVETDNFLIALEYYPTTITTSTTLTTTTVITIVSTNKNKLKKFKKNSQRRNITEVITGTLYKYLFDNVT